MDNKVNGRGEEARKKRKREQHQTYRLTDLRTDGGTDIIIYRNSFGVYKTALIYKLHVDVEWLLNLSILVNHLGPLLMFVLNQIYGFGSDP